MAPYRPAVCVVARARSGPSDEQRRQDDDADGDEPPEWRRSHGRRPERWTCALQRATRQLSVRSTCLASFRQQPAKRNRCWFKALRGPGVADESLPSRLCGQATSKPASSMASRMAGSSSNSPLTRRISPRDQPRPPRLPEASPTAEAIALDSGCNAPQEPNRSALSFGWSDPLPSPVAAAHGRPMLVAGWRRAGHEAVFRGTQRCSDVFWRSWLRCASTRCQERGICHWRPVQRRTRLDRP